MLQNLQSTELVYPGMQVLRSGVISGRDTSRPNVQRRYFGYAQRRAAPMELPESGLRRALGIELTVQTLKHGMGTVIGTQPQNPAPGVFDHAPGLEHDLLHHCLHTPPLGRMAQGCVFADECVLTKQAQDPVRCRMFSLLPVK